MAKLNKNNKWDLQPDDYLYDGNMVCRVISTHESIGYNRHNLTLTLDFPNANRLYGEPSHYFYGCHIVNKDSELYDTVTSLWERKEQSNE